MPTKWTPPEIFLQHKGVTTYRIYRHDNANDAREYLYGWSEDCSDDGDSFDVRDLPNPGGHDVQTQEGRKAVIKEAIEGGIVTNQGVVLPGEKQIYVTVRFPEGAWDLLEETLRKDSDSKAFDPALRRQITESLTQLQYISGLEPLLLAVREVLEWAERTGGWESSCWEQLQRAVKGLSKELDEVDPNNLQPLPARREYQEILHQIFDILYFEADDLGGFYNIDKTWNPDTLDDIADLVRPLFCMPKSETSLDDSDNNSRGESQ